MKGFKVFNEWSVLVIITVILALFAVIGRGSWSTSAQADGTLRGTVPVLPTVAGKLAQCVIVPDSSTLMPGQTQTLVYTAKDISGAPVGGIVVSWSLEGITAVLSTTSGTTSASSGQATTVLTATVPGGTANVKATGTEPITNMTCKPGTTVVTVSVPTATPAPIAPAPAATPTAVPTPATTPTPPAGAAQQLVTPQQTTKVETVDKTVAVNVPAGAVSQPVFVAVAVKNVADVPPAPAGFLLGSRQIEINVSDSTGKPVTDFRTTTSVTITIQLTQEDLNKAANGGQIVIQRYDPDAKAWIALVTTVDLVNKTASVSVTRFSTFAVTIKPVVMPTPTPTVTPTPVLRKVIVTLNELAGSGQSGQAVLTEQGTKTEVAITIKAGAAGVSQPAHIHDKDCTTPGRVLYPLTNVVNGTSTTLLDVALDTLQASKFAVRVHKSVPEISTYVSCGEIPRSITVFMASVPPATPAPTATSTAVPGTPTVTSVPTATPTPTPIPAVVTVKASRNPAFGLILTDSAGRTLYMFTRDEPDKSNATGGTLVAWPPLLTTNPPVAGDGVIASLLGTIKRPEGTTQVTYDKWPLYYYVRDTAPGQTSGQNVGTSWFVINQAAQLVVTTGYATGASKAGEAVLTAVGNKTQVTINITPGASGVAQPDHIHDKDCTAAPGAVKYALTDVLNGTSTTLVDVPLDTLQASSFAIRVHKSAAEISVYVACGEIPQTTPPTPTPTRTPTPVPPTATPTARPPVTGDVTPGSGLLLAMGLAGLMLVVAGGYLLRRSKSH